MFHHRSITTSFGKLVGTCLEETIAGFAIMLLVLIPYFAFRVLDEALGESMLAQMFFIEHQPIKPGQEKPVCDVDPATKPLLSIRILTRSAMLNRRSLTKKG